MFLLPPFIKIIRSECRPLVLVHAEEAGTFGRSRETWGTVERSNVVRDVLAATFQRADDRDQEDL
jgi:hypothetical protein